MKTDYETLALEQNGGVLIVRLNRPKALNALNSLVASEMLEMATEADRDPSVRVLLITGSEKAFAAGADISEMASRSYMDMHKDDYFAVWDRFAATRKPMIAAVSGYALGGGCELAMMCDFIIASDTAKFGQPEIKLGVMPGMGGSQRLTHLVGKSKAMDLCLTGRMMEATEAERCGLVARVVPVADLMTEALRAAEAIASYSTPIAVMCKETVNRAMETTLAEGIRFERRVFHSMFSLDDQKEGMGAFVEKRAPSFTDR